MRCLFLFTFVIVLMSREKNPLLDLNQYLNKIYHKKIREPDFNYKHILPSCTKIRTRCRQRSRHAWKARENVHWFGFIYLFIFYHHNFSSYLILHFLKVLLKSQLYHNEMDHIFTWIHTYLSYTKYITNCIIFFSTFWLMFRYLSKCDRRNE